MKTIHNVKHIVTDFLSDPNLFTSKYDRRYQDDEEALKMKLLALKLGRWNL